MGQVTMGRLTQAPAHRVCATQLSGVDAFAARAPDSDALVHDALVHVNQDLPPGVQDAVAGELLRRLTDADGGDWASMRLPAGEALTVPKQRGVRSIKL